MRRVMLSSVHHSGPNLTKQRQPRPGATRPEERTAAPSARRPAGDLTRRQREHLVLRGLLNDKVAVITGAGRGIGRAAALLFAEHGANVVVNDLGAERDGAGSAPAPADQVVHAIARAGGHAVANYADVGTPGGAESLIEQAVQSFGGLDILVNNAGILIDKTLLKLSDE